MDLVAKTGNGSNAQLVEMEVVKLEEEHARATVLSPSISYRKTASGTHLVNSWTYRVPALQ